MDDMELSMRATAEEYLKNAEYARKELEKISKIPGRKSGDDKKRKYILEEIYLESIEEYNALSEILKKRK